MTISQWHVPVDDENCYWYAIFTSFTGPVDKQQMREQRLATIQLPDYISRKNKRNNYEYSVEEQLSQTYTGMGMDINVHDQWACESMGPIQDRTREHLGTTDKGIMLFRRLLVKAIEAAQTGAPLPMRPGAQEAGALTGPPSIDGVAAADATASYCADADLARRQGSDWASARLAAQAEHTGA